MEPDLVASKSDVTNLKFNTYTTLHESKFHLFVVVLYFFTSPSTSPVSLCPNSIGRQATNKNEKLVYRYGYDIQHMKI